MSTLCVAEKLANRVRTIWQVGEGSSCRSMASDNMERIKASLTMNSKENMQDRNTW